MIIFRKFDKNVFGTIRYRQMMTHSHRQNMMALQAGLNYMEVRVFFNGVLLLSAGAYLIYPAVDLLHVYHTTIEMSEPII